MLLIEKTYTFEVSHSSSWRTDELLNHAISACFVAYVDTLRARDDAIFNTVAGDPVYSNETWLDGENGERIRKWIGLFKDVDALNAKMQHHGLDNYMDELNVPYHSIGATLSIKGEEL